MCPDCGQPRGSLECCIAKAVGARPPPRPSVGKAIWEFEAANVHLLDALCQLGRAYDELRGTPERQPLADAVLAVIQQVQAAKDAAQAIANGEAP